MKDFWNQRYAAEAFAYGTKPNDFLVQNLNLLPKGKILFVAEGEGRNAVYAAQNEFQVSAFDYSESGQQKALQLAQQKGVTIDYLVSDVLELPYQKHSFDVLVLIFAHFPAEIRKEAHAQLLDLLKPEGYILFEAFAKEQLQFSSGGPKDRSMLFSENEVIDEFQNIEFQNLSTEEVLLDEGPFHQGTGVVVRFKGIKI
jgi:2-polyprenyl-3-methyl-5-hydroxy-6-metoxy-1,4-benzoquinol methylase